MAISTTLAYDATHNSIGSLPRGAQVAGYTTGSGGIAWTSADWANHPGAVRIDQDYRAVDHTADVLDVENGAATPAECPGWSRAALANYRSGARPGQRSPAIYVNGSNLSAVCNSLVAGGVASGIGIWLADWNLNAVQAAARVVAGSGPFPIIGVQFSDAGLYDISAFSVPWLDTVSGGGGGGTPSISEGASGPAVVAAQTRLNVWGASLTVDGSFGPATTAAVRAFQTAHSMAVDGVTGPATWIELNKNPAPPPGKISPPSWLAIDKTRLALTWGPVNDPLLSGYTACAYGLDGNTYAKKVSTESWCVLDGLTPGWEYTISIWCNGGSVAPDATSVTVTMPA